MEVVKQWFKDWFNSSYYHLLYSNRNEQEAAAFLDKLIDYLKPQPGASMLDVACGRGRHSKYLADKGFDVTGIDLSEESIRQARHMEMDNLHFFQHDMRLPFYVNYFDVVFNFFTSFGYFSTQRENDNALRTIAQAMKPGGRVVLDYLNSVYVTEHLVESEVKERDGVVFDIHRAVCNKKFLKEINILDQVKLQRSQYTESVNAFTREDFERMFAKQGLKIIDVFGDYHFNEFNEKQSPRLILVAQK
ncbi:methyltransferase family protein [Chitinophaga skermanii]|uniref:Methyltransferase family protein n=1 Tax=Chitinophaga skermanii TaxID=331697 RepID=A0A327QF53_9BACT|nr:class I SAM-dependent methyltransferase [Chitinophaga skermanii]RAJ02625.1 methyltransferase family protein [Chitinophaga skermanii]